MHFALPVMLAAALAANEPSDLTIVYSTDFSLGQGSCSLPEMALLLSDQIPTAKLSLREVGIGTLHSDGRYVLSLKRVGDPLGPLNIAAKDRKTEVLATN